MGYAIGRPKSIDGCQPRVPDEARASTGAEPATHEGYAHMEDSRRGQAGSDEQDNRLDGEGWPERPPGGGHRYNQSEGAKHQFEEAAQESDHGGPALMAGRKGAAQQIGNAAGQEPHREQERQR